mmetsp:Transcript_23586/g.55627  ORF Transcript_23586/g.55627 Transcript_23586/m.55627 type:complete len:355 (-) Transcript_23586:163-1227(-)
MDAHRARRLGPAFLVLAVSGAALLSFVVPLGGRTQDLRSPSASGASGARTHGVTARQAFSWDADEPPPIPASPEEMLQQASDAVMRAYRDGKTRQAVRLRLDQLFDMESLYVKGIEALQLATVPYMESFVKKLWGGEYLQEIKTSVVDEQAGTLIYRESENELQDMAVFYLPGRDLMAEGKTQNFIRKMNDRLVLLVNSENAQSDFRVDYKGMDWMDYTSFGEQLCEMFSEQSYYYSYGPFESWQLTVFRAYPYNWEIYIEDLEYNTVKIFDSPYKPTSNQVVARIEQYEAKNEIAPYKKIGKLMKDTMRQEEASEEAEPGWRSSASPEEIMERQKQLEDRAKEEAKKLEKNEA